MARLGRPAGAPVEGDDQAVEPEVDLDQAPGIVPPATARWQLEDLSVEPDRVVAGDLAAVRGRHGEAGDETRQEGGQQFVRAGPVAHAGQPQLDDEPTLERAPQPLDSDPWPGASGR